MTARRQGSTTSLSKFARMNSPSFSNRSLDFCNAFWGPADAGVDVLFARMRGAARTVEELRAFWKERASIEEDYAKRLAKLAKMPIGRDEIGDLRQSFETLRSEMDHQAASHLQLALQIRSDLEMHTAAFHTRQLSHKKVQQAAIEKDLKTKQTQEAYVNKAREKYEQDCIRINSFTAQASLVQGKDLEKVNLKLERTQQTVQTNEREFASYAKALGETVQKWESNWKAFCDSCQDLEEDRMDFIKDNMWAYANAVSTVCVSDDESCEKIRLSLETMETERDMDNFVHDYGTGSQIPDPPTFVNYQNPDAIPSSSARGTSRSANFVRSSNRDFPAPRANGYEEDENTMVNTAGVGAGGGVRRAETYSAEANSELSRRGNRMSMGPPPQSHPPPQSQTAHTNGTSHHHQHQHQHQPNGVNASSGPSAPAPSASPPARSNTGAPQHPQLQRVLNDPHAEPIDPTAETFIKVGNNAYRADPNKDPQNSQSPPSRQGAPSPVKQNSAAVDPLMKQLEQLENVVSTTGSTRRNTMMKPKEQGQGPAQGPSQAQQGRGIGHTPSTSSSVRSGTAASLSLPAGSLTHGQDRTPSPGRDYRNSADMVVGGHPAVSRSPSPAPPTAAFMRPKSGPPPPGADVVQHVLEGYQQSLPGERKSMVISRSNSPGLYSPVGPGPAQLQGPTPASSHGQNLARPLSQMGHAGVGAHGGPSRSASPQPISRGPSPGPGHPHAQSRNSLIQPPPSGPVRSTSPNPVGIALDPSGRVLHDEMAQRYQHPPQQQQRPQQPVYNQPPPAQPPHQQPPMMHQPHQIRRSSTYMGPPPGAAPYSLTPSPQPTYPPPGPVYAAPPQAQPPVQYTPPAPLQHRQSTIVPQQPPVQMQPQQPGYGGYGAPGTSPGAQNGSLSRASGAGWYGGSGSGTPPQQQQPQQQQRLQHRQSYQAPPVQQQPQQPMQQHYRDPSPVGQYNQPQRMGHSPAPDAVQNTEDGNNILFYVKALYDYTATIEEEFDFQAGDIIAVTATPEDGWWSGELLDEKRRQRGRNVFPSNFVCLF